MLGDCFNRTNVWSSSLPPPPSNCSIDAGGSLCRILLTWKGKNISFYLTLTQLQLLSATIWPPTGRSGLTPPSRTQYLSSTHLQEQVRGISTINLQHQLIHFFSFEKNPSSSFCSCGISGPFDLEREFPPPSPGHKRVLHQSATVALFILLNEYWSRSLNNDLQKHRHRSHSREHQSPLQHNTVSVNAVF